MKINYTEYLVAEILELRRKNMLRADPEYQRGPVWSPAQKKRLVDSVLRGYPISLIYLRLTRTEVAGHVAESFEIVDGQQRINALFGFGEGEFRLFDPAEEEAQARFPTFIKTQPCPWGGKDFDSLDTGTTERFLNTGLRIAEVTTDDDNEIRDLFIRLQAGMPLTAQEKRDAWPGRFTDFVLKIGGKPQIARYPGHDFFKVLMGARSSVSRGRARQLAAQMAMLFLNRHRGAGTICDITGQAIDDFYYENIDFDASSVHAKRFAEALDCLTRLLSAQRGPKLRPHEAIDLLLLTDKLLEDYVPTWQPNFAEAFQTFRQHVVLERQRMKDGHQPGDFWNYYGSLTRAATARAQTIQNRYCFFARKMLEFLDPKRKDPNRAFDPLERELVFYQFAATCQVCGAPVAWPEAEVHHVITHATGGRTALSNAVLVHKSCHPKGRDAEQFADVYLRRRSEQPVPRLGGPDPETAGMDRSAVKTLDATKTCDWRGHGSRYKGRGKENYPTVVGYRFLESFHKANSLKDVLLGMLSELRRVHPTAFDRVLGLGGRVRPYFSRDPDDLRIPAELGDSGIFAEVHLSANNIRDMCRELLNLFGHSLGDFHVEVAGT